MIDERATAVIERLYAEDAAQRAAGLPSAQRTRNVERETGQWLNLLARTTGARSILEIGSSNGVSTIWFATAARENGGSVTGTEILPVRAVQANRNLAEAGLDNVAEVIAGDSRETIEGLTGPYDLIFIDAEKDDYGDHFLAVIDRVRPNGIILADNVTSHDLTAYQAMVRGRDDVESVTIPLGRGIEFTLKTR
jgi:predicted O-methyltransferase YrrM